MSETGDLSHSLLLQIRDEMRNGWQRQQPVVVEQFLERYPKLSSDVDAVLELIYYEFCIREAAGSQPTAREYLERFPGLKQELETLFAQHRGLPAASIAERQRDVSTERLLAETNSQLSLPGAASVELKEIVDRISRAGRFHIRQLLGVGGMGAVFKAFDKLRDEVVALKTIRHPRPDTILRFKKSFCDWRTSVTRISLLSMS